MRTHRQRIIILLGLGVLSLSACSTGASIVSPGMAETAAGPDGTGAVAAGPAVPQAVNQARLPPLPGAMPAPGASTVLGGETAPYAAATQQAEARWVAAERVMNAAGAVPEKRQLYMALCRTTDQSSCIMAAALERASD